MTRQEVRELLPERDETAHKRTFGKLAILAGSLGMCGAAVLCGKAALRSGAGLATFFASEELIPILQTACWEVMCRERSLSDTTRALREDGFTAVAAGPGLGEAKLTDALFFAALYETLTLPIVLDADGLNNLRRQDLLEEFRNMKVPKVITPHEGEAERLLEHPVTDREAAVKELARLVRGVAVLKGKDTLVADEYGRVSQNPTGNVALATGGTGDVLTGIIGSFLARGMDAFDAARAGAYLHGLAGDLACRKYGTYGTIATDLLKEIPAAILAVTEKEA